MDFRNVQRRVYDALSVLEAMGIIQKGDYHIVYNHFNEYLPHDFLEATEEDSQMSE